MQPHGVVNVSFHGHGGHLVMWKECITRRHREGSDNYRIHYNSIESTGVIFLPPLPKGNSFVVNSSLMQMLTTRGLFAGLPSEDHQYACMTRLMSVCMNSLG